jgi:hypothetical protein
MAKPGNGQIRPPKQPIRQIERVKLTPQKAAALAQKEEDDYTLLCAVADDVIPALCKLIPSLDPMQGGPPSGDVFGDHWIERIDRLAFKNPRFQQTLIGIRKKKYFIDRRWLFGKWIDVHRTPTRDDLRKAVRFSAHELQYIRTETIKDDPELGEPLNRGKRLANSILMWRIKQKMQKKKRLKKIEPLETPLTASYKRNRRTTVSRVPPALPAPTARVKRQNTRSEPRRLPRILRCVSQAARA